MLEQEDGDKEAGHASQFSVTGRAGGARGQENPADQNGATF